MDSSKAGDEVVFDFSPILRVYKSGRVERLLVSNPVPPSTDPVTGVSSKDVVIVPETGLIARLYLSKATDPFHKKLPLLVYFHGGAFCVGSAFSPIYHHYLNSLAAEANVVIVSVEYRLAPEHPLPIAYDDSWDALEWVASHSIGEGSDAWLNDHADFTRVFMGGDSAGANIVHNMAMRAQEKTKLPGVNLIGAVLIHPFFAGVQPVGSEIQQRKASVERNWLFLCPTSSGCDDPLINPLVDPNLSRLGCERVLVCVAEKDQFRDRGLFYCQVLEKSGWEGKVEFMEAKGKDHVFHLFDPTCEDAVSLKKRFVSFLNLDLEASSKHL